MIWTRLGSIRGQLVLWYLSVLAVILLALGIFQSVTLLQYLQSTSVGNVRHSAYAELRILGSCFIQSPTDLRNRAQTLATLLGSPGTAVKIVTPSGETIADHSFGVPGNTQPFQLSAGTIRLLVAKASPPPASAVPGNPRSACLSPTTPATQVRPLYLDEAWLSQGSLILFAVPLGMYSHPVGYALLGRSFSSAEATIRRTGIIFALGALAALLLAVLVALPLINRALRPLRRIARTAGLIAAGDLQQRANLAHTPDEVGRLGSAFDTMVDRLEQALTSAQQSEKRMRRFLADASHELRTPLTVLRGMSEVLVRQGAGERPELTAALLDMHEESLRLSRLVDDLLTLTRMDAGQPLKPVVVPLRRFLEEFVARYSGAWPQRRIDLEVGALDSATTYVDPDALRRIVTNLIDNAARYSTAGGPVVLEGQAESGIVTLLVSDDGPGMSAEDAKRVFERFYRGAKSRTRNSGGSGLGLAIVQALAEQSGGQVTIDSAPDRGTTVSITLPASSRSP